MTRDITTQLGKESFDPDRLSPEDRRLYDADCQRIAYGGEQQWALIPGDPPRLATFYRTA